MGYDPLSGKRVQVTKRGFSTAADAAAARQTALEEVEEVDDGPRPSAAPRSLTVDGLLDLYLDGIDAYGRLAPKTRHAHRSNADLYVRPWLGELKVRDLSPDVVLAWQRDLRSGVGTKRGKPLSPNTVRLARASLAGAVKHAVRHRLLTTDPLAEVPRPKPRRSTPKHWSPEQARAFLRSQEGDRLYPLWAFLLGCGLRVGELVWLRRDRVDFERRQVRIVDFATTLGYEGTDHVFSKPAGGSYHPQDLSKTLAELSVEAGLPRLTAHGLRHTSATLMLDQGVAPKVAAERLGHADPVLFLSLYSHVTPTMQRDAVDAIGALFGSG